MIGLVGSLSTNLNVLQTNEQASVKGIEDGGHEAVKQHPRTRPNSQGFKVSWVIPGSSLKR